MIRIRRVGAARDSVLENRLRAITDRLRLRNVFNPSPIEHDGTLYVAFRAIGPDGGRVRAYLARLEQAGEVITDLTSFANDLGIPFIADPKLLMLDGDVYVTFNSGYSARDVNTIYLQRVSPRLGVPQACLLSERQKVEKNWAFFRAGAELRAVYSLQPLMVLVLREGRLGDHGPLTFDHRDRIHSAHRPVGLTLGSQMLVEAERGLLIAHSKIRVGRRRAYVGHLVELGLADDTPSVSISQTSLIDSWRALWPVHDRLNPNLWSATYFSGIARIREELLLGYGVNDSRAALARVSEEMIA
ncbi:hypothetical protein [Microbacterium sp. E-13]|uniref:hypothetical protein n=1 Tax=Microbacterium sp. E-13 TaxID=3404048 RepID=UPI003CEDEB4E